jgi:hypothetical protein
MVPAEGPRERRRIMHPTSRLLLLAGAALAAVPGPLAAAGLDGPCRPGQCLLAPSPGERSRGPRLAALWQDLASGDFAVAYSASWRLAQAEGADAYLASRLRPVVGVPAARRNAALLALTNDDYLTRRRAERDLEAMGEAVADDLLRLSRAAGDLDRAQRARRLLDRVGPASPGAVRARRAVLVLEDRGTRTARDLLKRLAAGMPEAPLTREARGALARLQRR